MTGMARLPRRLIRADDDTRPRWRLRRPEPCACRELAGPVRVPFGAPGHVTHERGCPRPCAPTEGIVTKETVECVLGRPESA
jgi:hypothetical protein